MLRMKSIYFVLFILISTIITYVNTNGMSFSDWPICCNSADNQQSGICVATNDLDAQCQKLEISFSDECSSYRGSWCCQVPKSVMKTDGNQSLCSNGIDIVDDTPSFVQNTEEQAMIKKIFGPDKRSRGMSRRPRKPRQRSSLCSNIASPLILTNMIRTGNIAAAQQASQVFLPGMNGQPTSFSGYFTVNGSDNSNMFFWFFPAEVSTPTSVPLVTWLQGGPGASSLFATFVETGPFRVDQNLNLQLHPYRWTKVANMLFVENPVGTGFSFTNTRSGFSTNQNQVGQNMLELFRQFYQLFPQYQSTPLFLAGESYAGKFIPATAKSITANNQASSFKIPLQGLAIGNGYVDPGNMAQYSSYLYQHGMLDEGQRDQMAAVENQYRQFISQQQWGSAFSQEGQIFGFPGLFNKFTSSEYVYNYLYTVEPREFYYYGQYLEQCGVRSALHVGNQVFADLSNIVYDAMGNDFPQSAAPLLTAGINNYRVMLFNGLLDVICAHPLVESYLKQMTWNGANDFRNADKEVWKVEDTDDEIAGYVQQSGNLALVGVRGAGHMVPYDNPRSALDLINRFINNLPFTSNDERLKHLPAEKRFSV